MDTDEIGEAQVPDIGERLRTWRLFLIKLRWLAVTAVVALVLLLSLRPHG